jgi:hypothetical protein
VAVAFLSLSLTPPTKIVISTEADHSLTVVRAAEKPPHLSLSLPVISDILTLSTVEGEESLHFGLCKGFAVLASLLSSSK